MDTNAVVMRNVPLLGFQDRVTTAVTQRFLPRDMRSCKTISFILEELSISYRRKIETNPTLKSSSSVITFRLSGPTSFVEYPRQSSCFEKYVPLAALPLLTSILPLGTNTAVNSTIPITSYPFGVVERSH